MQPESLVHDPPYLEALGVNESAAMKAGQLWRHLVEEVFMSSTGPDESWRETLEDMLDRGPLARRIRRALDYSPERPEPSREKVRRVYERLCDCLDQDELFDDASI